MSDSVFKSRIKNSKRNIVSGLIKQLSSILLQFFIRTAIIYSLGAEYQGVNGLFTSILQVLNLSDLGFNAAVTFVLYKPIANNNINEINAIIAFLKKVYTIIGIVVLSFGILIIPFLNKLILGNYPSDINIYILFIIYLANSVISYFLFAYKSTLLTAYQREDIVSNIYTITMIGSRIIQLILILLFKNYYLYVLILPIGSIVNNVFVQIYSKKLFPNIFPNGIIKNSVRSELNKQVKAVFINRLSDVARNSFDNIVLSAFLGLISVAIYDNYYYIFSAIYGVMGIIARGIKASVGNSLVVETQEKNYNDLSTFTFLFMWLVGWCTVCMFCLYQPFMHIWMRNDGNLILSFFNMSLFCIYFYAISMTYTKGVFLEAKGLYWECRWWFVLEAISNLILNIVLGKVFGITGILIATIITILIFNFYGGTETLFKYYFNIGKAKFYRNHFTYFICTVFASVVTYYLCSLVIGNGILGLAIKAVICLIVPNILFAIFYFNKAEFKNASFIIKRMLF